MSGVLLAAALSLVPGARAADVGGARAPFSCAIFAAQPPDWFGRGIYSLYRSEELRRAVPELVGLSLAESRSPIGKAAMSPLWLAIPQQQRAGLKEPFEQAAYLPLDSQKALAQSVRKALEDSRSQVLAEASREAKALEGEPLARDIDALRRQALALEQARLLVFRLSQQYGGALSAPLRRVGQRAEAAREAFTSRLIELGVAGWSDDWTLQAAGVPQGAHVAASPFLQRLRQLQSEAEAASAQASLALQDSQLADLGLRDIRARVNLDMPWQPRLTLVLLVDPKRWPDEELAGLGFDDERDSFAQIVERLDELLPDLAGELSIEPAAEPSEPRPAALLPSLHLPLGPVWLYEPVFDRRIAESAQAALRQALRSSQPALDSLARSLLAASERPGRIELAVLRWRRPVSGSPLMRYEVRLSALGRGLGFAEISTDGSRFSVSQIQRPE